MLKQGSQRILGAVFAFVFMTTTSSPVWALRQTGLEESPERVKLANALLGQGPPASLNQKLTTFPRIGGLSDWLAAGLEEGEEKDSLKSPDPDRASLWHERFTQLKKAGTFQDEVPPEAEIIAYRQIPLKDRYFKEGKLPWMVMIDKEDLRQKIDWEAAIRAAEGSVGNFLRYLGDKVLALQEVAELAVELVQEGERLQTRIRALEVKLRETQAKADEDRLNAEAAAKDLKGQIAELEKLLSENEAALREAKNKVAAQEAQIEAGKAEIGRFKEEVEKLQGRLDKAEEEAAVNESAIKGLKSIEKERDEAQGKLQESQESLRSANERLAALETQISALEIEKDDLANQLSEANQNLGKERQAVADATEAKRQAQEASSNKGNELTVLNEKFVQAEATLKQTQADRDTAQRERDEAKAEVEKLNESLESARKDLETRGRELKETSDRAATLQAEITQLNDKLNGAKKERERDQAAINALQAEKDDLANQLSEATQKLQEKEKELAQANQGLQASSKEKEELALLKAKLTGIRKVITNAEEKAQVANGELNRLRGDLAGTETKLTKQIERALRADQRTLEQQGTIQRLDERVTELEKEIETLRRLSGIARSEDDLSVTWVTLSKMAIAGARIRGSNSREPLFVPLVPLGGSKPVGALGVCLGELTEFGVQEEEYQAVAKAVQMRLSQSNLLDDLGRYDPTATTMENSRIRSVIEVTLKEAVVEAHGALMQHKSQDWEPTERLSAVVALVTNGVLFTAHVKGSRVYVGRKGQWDPKKPANNPPEPNQKALGGYDFGPSDVYVVETPLTFGDEIFLYPKGRKTDAVATGNVSTQLAIPFLSLNGRARALQGTLYDPSLLLTVARLLTVASGLEEPTLAELLTELERGLRVGPKETSLHPALVRRAVSRIEALAAETDAEVAMSARRVKQGIRQVTLEVLLEAVEPLRTGKGGSWTESDVLRPTVFRFDHSNTVPWALPVALVGVPVAVVTEYETEAKVLRKLFETNKIPEGRYLVVSREKALWDDEALERLFEKNFPEWSYWIQPVPPEVDLLQVEKFFQQHGLIFYSDVTDVVGKTEAYLDSLA